MRALYNRVAGLHITGWLKAMGQRCDVVDDETLHAEGRNRLTDDGCLIVRAPRADVA